MVEKLCSRVVILSRGQVVESRRVDQFDRAGGNSLESTFVRVTEQPDYAPVAREIFDIIRAS
jgi:ABC-type methionine transport system ATPase subunit